MKMRRERRKAGKSEEKSHHWGEGSKGGWKSTGGRGRNIKEKGIGSEMGGWEIGGRQGEK